MPYQEQAGVLATGDLILTQTLGGMKPIADLYRRVASEITFSFPACATHHPPLFLQTLGPLSPWLSAYLIPSIP